MNGLLGRHFGVQPGLYFNFRAVGAGVGSLRSGRTQAESQEMSIVQEKIPFLGHIVSAGGIGPDPAKCRQVKNWRPPCTCWPRRGRTLSGQREGTRLLNN